MKDSNPVFTSNNSWTDGRKDPLEDALSAAKDFPSALRRIWTLVRKSGSTEKVN